MRGSPGLRTSLRWRLTAWVAGVMLLSAAVTFVVVYRGTGAQLRGQVDRDISDHASQLSMSLKTLAGKTAPQIALAAGGYVRSQPYRATSTLLFVTVPGAGTTSNHPELFGAHRAERGEAAADQARENALGQRLLSTRLGRFIEPAPDIGDMRILERPVRIGPINVVVGAGEPLAIVASAERGVGSAFILAGSLTLALALLASYLAGARVSAPLRRMAAVAARVDAGDLRPRMKTAGGQSEEVRVLAETFDHMLDRLTDAFTGQRDFVADASHELRTPLTVIRGQLDVLAAQDAPSREEVHRVERLVQAEIGRISRLVDDLLLLAQSEQTDFLRLESIDLEPFVSELWDGVSLTAGRRFELGEVPRGAVRADPDRLAQALRNLARNAIEHTEPERGLVRLEVALVAPDGVRFAVLDDGPGIPIDERERVFERFHRTDSSRSRVAGGAGLGLAIVRAIAEAHGGAVSARGNADGLGARFELVLPGGLAAVQPAG